MIIKNAFTNKYPTCEQPYYMDKAQSTRIKVDYASMKRIYKQQTDVSQHILPVVHNDIYFDLLVIAYPWPMTCKPQSTIHITYTVGHQPGHQTWSSDQNRAC